ncbi:MAG: hypothetical protein HOZ81_46820 [Streptomyces sp.]|nr:hypothetical protein [Streptomyces sp.]NUS24439.1 hypothetical protein [Streptomyces sp.]
MDQPNDMADQTRDQARDGNGQYTRDPETVARDAEATRLRSRGLSYRQIAAELGMHPSSAYAAVQRAMAEVIAEPASEALAFELARLDELHRAALGVLERRHVTVSNGRVIYVDDKPLLDDGPVLQAIDRLVKISESRRRLLGLDQPAKTQVSGGLMYEIVGVDPAELS